MTTVVPSKEDLYKQLQRIQQSNALSRSSNLSKLLEYLVQKEIQRIEQQLTTTSLPKELEIAIDVFDKNVNFNSNEDASVRVHVSRLRKKLLEYYLQEGKQEDFRIVIPVGEYRLVFIKNTHASTYVDSDKKAKKQSSFRLTALKGYQTKYLIPFCILSLLIHFFFITTFDVYKSDKTTLNPIWAEYQSPKVKNIIVLGTQAESSMRETHHNDRRMSKGLVLAFKNILTLSNDFRYTPVILSSDLSANDIKQANIIYIGHFENMGVLANYFSGSQYSFDSENNRLNVKNTTEAFYGPKNTSQQYTDYGLFAKVDGPRNNKIYIISGFTDSSLLWLSWFLTSNEETTQTSYAASLESELSSQHKNVEMLFKINSMDGQDLSHELISNATITSKTIWHMPD